MTRSLLGLILLLATAATQAHGIWFAQRAGKTALIYGDGAEDSDVIKRLDKLRDLNAYDAQGKPLPIAWIKTDHLLWVDESVQPAILTAVLDNGLWTKTAQGEWLAQGKTGLSGYVSSSHNLKYALRWQADLTSPMPVLPNQLLQVMPQVQVLPKWRHDKLPLQVLFKGQPVAGAEVVVDLVNDPDAKPLLTDRHGKVTVRVRNQGLNVITVQWRGAPPVGVDVDYTEYVTTLSFVLPHQEE